MPAVVATRPVTERALDVLRRVGNPFRNYFARNPDDDVCARYHVPELFARERGQLLGVGGSQGLERTQWLIDSMARPSPLPFAAGGVRRACDEANLDSLRACQFVCDFVEKTEAHNTAGLMRRYILQGFARTVFLGDEA